MPKVIKQYITLKQWKELCKLLEVKSNCEVIHIINNDMSETSIAFSKMNIGRMIEFLGDYWCEQDDGQMIILPKNDKLCDWLFNKIKNRINYA